jgi:hypothetical protein
MVDAAVKSAVAIASPVAGVVAAPLIDAVDSYVQGLLTGVAPPVTSTEDPIVSLQKHVAALTVASGHATSSAMTATKVASAPLKPADQDSDASAS